MLINPFYSPPGGWTPFSFFAYITVSFGTPIHISSPHMLLTFSTKVTQGQVTRSRQVTSPQKKFECSSLLHRLTNRLGLTEIDIRDSIYKIYISEFWYRWPKVRSILRPHHYKSMGENWKAPLLNENHSKHSNIEVQVDLTPSIGKLQPVTPLMSPRSLQVMKGHLQVLRNIFYKDKRSPFRGLLDALYTVIGRSAVAGFAELRNWVANSCSATAGDLPTSW